MASKAQTPLRTAMSGDVDKLSEKQTKSALTAALGRITRSEKLANTTKEAVMETGTALMHTAETMGSLFLASMAEGFVGPEKMKVGGVDLRAPAGCLLQGLGLYQTLAGEDGSGHFLHIGNGVTGSWLASVGQDAGQALRARKEGGTPAAPAATTPPSTSFRGQEPVVQVPELEGLLEPPFGYDPSRPPHPYAQPFWRADVPPYPGHPAYGSQQWPPAWPPGPPQPWQGWPGTGHFSPAGLLPQPSPYPQWNIPGNPAMPGVPQGYGPAPTYWPAQPGYPERSQPAAPAPRLSGPVREILPTDLEPSSPSWQGSESLLQPGVAGSGPHQMPQAAMAYPRCYSHMSMTRPEQMPGPMQPGPMQPGSMQPGSMQPGPMQPGPMHPGPMHPGLMQPGPDLAGRPIMRFTPEAPPNLPRMRFTPEADSGNSPDGSSGGSSDGASDIAGPGGPGRRFVAARLASRLPRDGSMREELRSQAPHRENPFPRTPQSLERDDE